MPVSLRHPPDSSSSGEAIVQDRASTLLFLASLLNLGACVDRDLRPELFCVPPCGRDGGSNDIDGQPNRIDGGPESKDGGQIPDTGAIVDAGPPRCGDGIVTPPEDCDDGNEDDLDGCEADCSSVEEGYLCPRAGEACILWWNEEATHRIRIDVTPNGSELPAGFATSVQFDHQTLVSADIANPDGSDVHLIREAPSGTFTELDRYLDPLSSWNSPQTRLWFKLPEAVATNGSDRSLYLYFGASHTPMDDPERIFLFFDDFSAEKEEWSVGGGTPPVLEDHQTPWDEGESSVLHARNDGATESNLTRRLPVDTFGVSSTTFVFFPPNFDSDTNNGPVLLNQYCGSSCEALNGMGRIGGIGANGTAPRVGLYSSAGVTGGELVPEGTWIRLELDVSQSSGSATLRLHINDEETGSMAFRFDEPIQDARLGIFLNSTGIADVFFDNTWDRHFVRDQPLVTPQPIEPAWP